MCAKELKGSLLSIPVLKGTDDRRVICWWAVRTVRTRQDQSHRTCPCVLFQAQGLVTVLRDMQN